MTSTVQFYLEQMIPELEDLERKELFTQVFQWTLAEFGTEMEDGQQRS
jgi:hypothetical protein